MAVAVVGMLSGITGSLRNAARLTAYDRIMLAARSQMDALLAERRLPKMAIFQGEFDPAVLGGVKAGWRAQAMPFEQPPAPGPHAQALRDSVESDQGRVPDGVLGLQRGRDGNPPKGFICFHGDRAPGPDHARA